MEFGRGGGLRFTLAYPYNSKVSESIWFAGQFGNSEQWLPAADGANNSILVVAARRKGNERNT
jgi:hypothetical protein